MIQDEAQQQAYQVLRKAFSVLDAAQIENFIFHLKNETPVLCRNNASRFYDGRGAG
jgi:hypothetical protein